MSYVPNYIASYEQDSGLQNYLEPFLIPEKAYVTLEDCFCWRGRVKRRRGVKTLGRLRRVLTAQSLGNSSASPWSFNVHTLLGLTGEDNAEIQAGSLTITLGAITLTDNGLGVLTSSTVGNSGTVNYVTWDVVLTHTAGSGVATKADLNYYPALPVLGLPTREIAANIDNDQMVAFDQKYAYTYSGSSFSELTSTTPTTWGGPTYSQFFSTNYWFKNGVELFWTTNFNPGASGDPIRYYDGTTWTDFSPTLDSSSNKLWTCRVLLPYKNRLIALNTWEGSAIGTATNVPNRARWSWIGDPTDTTNGWLSTPGKGGFIDAPTTEIIVGAEFIKDVLVVKFEKSSWKLVYTGNNQLPFVWQKINREMGSESTFSLIPFDGGVFSVGNLGITTDDSVSVQRIDIQIPNQVFQINALNNGIKRVSGIRDYVNQLVYWAYPDNTTSNQSNLIYPNKVLVYNYINNTYSIFNDSFTCFGYYQNQTAATWANTNFTWAEYNVSWNYSNQGALQPDVACGNQDGYVFTYGGSSPSNGASLPIWAIGSGMITIKNHNFVNGTAIVISGIIGSGFSWLNGNSYIVNVVDADNITLKGTTITAGTYIGGGEVSVINNFDIVTKVFVPTYSAGSQCRLGYVDFLLDKTSSGECTCDIFVDENANIPLNDPSLDDTMLGTNVLQTYPESTTQPIVQFQQNQQKIWHRMFFNVVCQNFQMEMTMNEDQLLDSSISGSDFILHAMTIYTSANSRLIQ